MNRFPLAAAPQAMVPGLSDLVQELRQLTSAINRMADTNEQLTQALMEAAAEDEQGEGAPPQFYMDGSPIR